MDYNSSRQPKLKPVEELLTRYAACFAEDFTAVVPALEKRNNAIRRQGSLGESTWASFTSEEKRM